MFDQFDMEFHFLNKNMQHVVVKVIKAFLEFGTIHNFLSFKSQIDNLIPDPSFGHNLRFKSPNGSHEPILDIYIPRAFQWYKELLNPMSFDPYNCPLKIQETMITPTPKVGVHLGVWVSFLHTLLHS
jgi:hypothetical protein